MKATLRDDKVILEFNIGNYDKNTIDFLTNIELSVNFGRDIDYIF